MPSDRKERPAAIRVTQPDGTVREIPCRLVGERVGGPRDGSVEAKRLYPDAAARPPEARGDG
jgi:hypothetical protein